MTEYKFVREDNREVVTVGFDVAILQDAAGYITLDDGTRARRVREHEVHRAPVDPQNANQTPPVSDAMGFPIHQFAEFEYDRTQNAFHGVEFKPDPACPEFMQVHFASHRDRDRYMKHRGMVDRNKTAGAALSKKDLEDAAKYAKNIGKQKESVHLGCDLFYLIVENQISKEARDGESNGRFRGR